MISPEERERIASQGGYICGIEGGQPYGWDRNPNGTFTWRINPECEYHKIAASRPDDHSIPWNCPTFWDKCNCDNSS